MSDNGAVFTDFLVLVVVVLAAVGGWRRGGTAIALHVAGLLIGLVLGLRVAAFVSGALSASAHVLLGLLCALGGMIIGGAIGRRLGSRAAAGVARAHLRLLDRSLGAVTRGLGAALLCWLVVALVLAVGPATWSRALRDSRVADGAAGVPLVGPAVAGIERAVASAAPSDVAALVPDIRLRRTPAATVARVGSGVADKVFEIGATGCNGSVVGSGFVAGYVNGDALVVTNAHVVRGADVVTVDTATSALDAVPIVVDRRADLAVLRVGGLDVVPLQLADADAANGARAVVVGYPHGGPRRAVGAVVEQRLPVPDPGFSDGLALHLAYRLAADIEPGNSGSPLLDGHSRVLGVVNATAGEGAEQGYAITDTELRPDLLLARSASGAAGTGTCG